MLARCLERVAACHHLDRAAFVPWTLDEVVVGRVHRERVATLLAADSPFRRDGERLRLLGDDFASRSAGLSAWVAAAAAQGLVRAPTGELYPVAARPWETPLAAVDRVAVPWLGVAAQGVHVNGFVRGPQGLQVWIARRARGKPTFPGHLDNFVAGGQGLGCEPAATVVKECREEASVPAALAAAAVPVGVIHYLHQDGLGSKADTLWLFDLELPAAFVPRPDDGEVEAFEAWTVERLRGSLLGDEPWKPNCALVALDFLLRHGGFDGVLSGDERWRLWQALRGR